MICPTCGAAVPTELEQLMLEPRGGAWRCPCCLRRHRDDDPRGGRGDVSVGRFALRRVARRAYMEIIRGAGRDGRSRCPNCEHPLSPEEQLILQSSERFCCPECAHDLAREAYRGLAFEEAAWLAVVAALEQVKGEPDCANCGAVIVASRICQYVLSWIPKNYARQSRVLAELVRRPERAPEVERQLEGQDAADCWSSCGLIRTYQDRVGDRLEIL